jgi:hypothetical protein
MTDVPEFLVVTAPEVRRCIDGARPECVDEVADIKWISAG